MWRNGRRKATAGHGQGGRKEERKAIHQQGATAATKLEQKSTGAGGCVKAKAMTMIKLEVACDGTTGI
jgi:hypothetical protein